MAGSAGWLLAGFRLAFWLAGWLASGFPAGFWLRLRLALGWHFLAGFGWLLGWLWLALGWLLAGFFGWLFGWFWLAWTIVFSWFLARLAEAQLRGILQAYLGVVLLQPLESFAGQGRFLDECQHTLRCNRTRFGNSL